MDKYRTRWTREETILAFDRGLIILDFDYPIIVSDKLKKVPMDEETRRWIKNYDRKQIWRAASIGKSKQK